MPTVLHPRALDETDGSVPHRVTILGERYNIDQETGTVDVDDEQHAEELARSYDLDRSAIEPGDDEEGESEPDEPDTCQHILTSGDREGEPCGRDLPCPYHPEAET